MSVDSQLLNAAKALSDRVDGLSFSVPITHAYNPLDYAWSAHEIYIKTYATGRKRVVFLGMNPGPFGMVQTAVPFGEINAVRNWMKLYASVGKPNPEHPKRPVDGFNCQRSEISGQRLWGLFASRFSHPQDFFAEHFVVNYCPLAFMEASGRNRTPDKLPKSELDPVYDACDVHLEQVVDILQPEWVIGVGKFAYSRIQNLFKNQDIKTGIILHPSPASPAANRDWAGTATKQLQALKVW